MALNRTQVVVMLGMTQTLSWASSCYLLAVLARPISQSVGSSCSLVFGAFFAALLLAAAVGPVAGAPAASVFAIFHGLGNGILTIAIGTLPLKGFGAQGYGQRQGWLMVPARTVQAGSPFLFGLALANWESQALWLSALLAISAFAALWTMHVPAQE